MAASIASLCLLALFLGSASAALLGEEDLEVGFTLSDITPDEGLLSYAYYAKSCPQLEEIINRHVKAVAKDDKTLLASLLRLHFHDCAVRGCDASILLDHEGSEKTAEVSKTLRGFEVIDNIKAEVEEKCPKKVSCTDILTAVARDATVEIGGPYWSVPYGRKDGKVSLAEEATRYVPTSYEDITTLIEFAQSNDLTFIDLVVLSGAHTIGRTSCGSVQGRLYNYNNTGKCDSSMHEKFANYLKRKCRWASEYVDLDPITPMKFDNMYFKNLQKGMSLLQSDQELYSDSRTKEIVNALASSPQLFKHAFKAAMTKFGKIKALTGDNEGEIRVKCSCVNY